MKAVVANAKAVRNFEGRGTTRKGARHTTGPFTTEIRETRNTHPVGPKTLRRVSVVAREYSLGDALAEVRWRSRVRMIKDVRRSTRQNASNLVGNDGIWWGWRGALERGMMNDNKAVHA